MKKEGSYNNRNFSLLSIDSNSDSAVIHETIHQLLTMQTIWGNLEYTFNHIGTLIDSEFSHIYKFVNSNCKAIQETIAYLWELLIIAVSDGEEKFMQELNILEYKDSIAYNYLKLIKPLFTYRNTYSVIYIANLIYTIAIYSMNTEIKNLPLDIWLTKESLEEYFKDKSLKTPNGVFMNEILKVNEIFKEDDEEVLSEYEDSILNDWSSPDLSLREELLEELKSYYLKIASKFKTYDIEVKAYINEIKVKYVKRTQLLEFAIPTNYRPYKYSDSNLILSGRKNNCILLILGNYSDAVYSLKRGSLHRKIYNFKMDENTLFLCEYNTDNSTVNFGHASLSKFHKRIYLYGDNICITYKSYENNTRLKKFLRKSRQAYFVYCDRSYYYGKRTILSLASESNYWVIKENKLRVICIELNEYATLILPIIENNEEAFYNDIKDGYFNLKLDKEVVPRNEIIIIKMITSILSDIES